MSSRLREKVKEKAQWNLKNNKMMISNQLNLIQARNQALYYFSHSEQTHEKEHSSSRTKQGKVLSLSKIENVWFLETFYPKQKHSPTAIISIKK